MSTASPGAEFGRALALAGISNVPCRRLEIPDQESALRLAEITRRLADLISDFRPEAVFTHPWEGGHPDHDACAFAVHHAVELTQRADLSLPAIVEAAFYHEAEGRFETGCFLPDSAPAATVVYQLSPEEQARKQALLDCFVTQRQTLAGFSLDCEQFRIAPRYDFRRPHPGPVLYDRYPWGMSSQRFCALAQAAEEELAHA
jgi:LmbE family N-acetylglucosaminyl deacetylase